MVRSVLVSHLCKKCFKEHMVSWFQIIESRFVLFVVFSMEPNHHITSDGTFAWLHFDSNIHWMASITQHKCRSLKYFHRCEVAIPTDNILAVDRIEMASCSDFVVNDLISSTILKILFPSGWKLSTSWIFQFKKICLLIAANVEVVDAADDENSEQYKSILAR